MKKASWMVVVFTLAATVPTLSGHGQERKPKGVRDLMQQKLEHSQKVLEGIATANFNAIATHGDELIAISHVAEWKVLKSPRYELHSDDFRRNAEALVKAAKDKNLDAATLAYVDLTLNCVKCHKYVREVRMTRRDGRPDADRAARLDPSLTRDRPGIE
jgi:hypothetical protein